MPPIMHHCVLVSSAWELRLPPIMHHCVLVSYGFLCSGNMGRPPTAVLLWLLLACLTACWQTSAGKMAEWIR